MWYWRAAERVLYIRFSFMGLATSFREEMNIKVLTGYGITLIVASWLRGTSGMKVAVLVSLCVIMLAFELMNSAVERICNFISPEPDANIKKIKDIASAAVFLPGVLFTAFWLWWMCSSVSL